MKWRYPLSDIDLGKEEEQEVLRILRSRWLSMGPVTERFERAFTEYLGGGYATAVSNGTAALHLALASLGIEEGDEVVLPSLPYLCRHGQCGLLCRSKTCVCGYRQHGKSQYISGGN